MKTILFLASLVILYPNIVFADQPDSSPVQTQGSSSPTSREKIRVPKALTPLSKFPDADPLKSEAIQKKAAIQGFRMGSFIVSPEISLSELYDDNIYATRSREVQDWSTIISPRLSIKSDWSKHSLKIRTGATAESYRTNTSENTKDSWFETGGRIDISGKTNVYAGAGVSRNHEDRANLDDPNRALLSAEPTLYWDANAHLGIFRKFNKVSVRLATTYEYLNFKSVPTLAGSLIDMNDRDRKLYATGGRVSFKLSPKYEVFAQAASDTRRYLIDSANRNSDGYQIAAGLGLDLGGNNKAEAYLGHLKQNYENSAFTDVSKPYFGAEAKFATGPSTYITAFIDRELAETTIPGSSSYLSTTLGAKMDHDMSQALSVNTRLAISHSDFQDISRNEDYLEAGLGAKYYISKDVYLSGDYSVLLRESSVTTNVTNGTQSTFDYSKNMIYFSIGYTPERAPRVFTSASTFVSDIFLASNDTENIRIPANNEYDYSGFYVGAQTGYESINTELYSIRASGGSDTMDMGNLGGGRTSGLFAGYGRMSDRIYYGVEVEMEDSDDRWSHQKVKPDARTMYVEKNEANGINLRLGYALKSSLLYGSYGVGVTDFHTYDTENNYGPAGAFDQTSNLSSKQYSIGMDIPTGSNLFVRMNYRHTTFDDYLARSFADSTGATLTVDNLNNSESLFRVGLGWNFGSQNLPIKTVDAASSRGFYAGAKIGHVALNTSLDAIHNDGGGAGCADCPFAGDFGNTGATGGIFGGYGTTFKRIYMGLEIEAEASKVAWVNDREAGGGSGGRDVSVSKKSSHGIGIKVGYVTNNGALFYGRTGKVQTRFNTIYVKGSNATNWVDRDDTLLGNRLSIGAEVPASQNSFVQLDYAVTYYDGYGFTTLHGQPDTENFQNKEGLFSIGFGMRF